MKENNSSGIGCACETEKSKQWKVYWPVAVSSVMLFAGLASDYYFHFSFFQNTIRLAWYLLAYLPVGVPVIVEAAQAIRQREFFTEFTLMIIATIGAFFIGEYPEGVAVMLFYSIGELFQESAIDKATRNIKALLDIRPAQASVFRNGKYETVAPETVEIGETIQLKAGEKVPLDGKMLSATGSFDTAALTGESLPRTLRAGEQVLAGMLCLDKVVDIKADKLFEDSALAKILELVQNATARKAKAELFIRRFAKIYTPVVFCCAVLLAVVPYFIVSDYVFTEWLYRALIFLVISCPCALVISIPLGYFGGIGVASKHGILFKGSNFLDIITKVNTVVMDKTGTLTRGVFRVQEVVTEQFDKTEFINLVAELEKKSTHPVAKAVVEYNLGNESGSIACDIEEIAGYGLMGIVEGRKVLAGNTKLLKKFAIDYNPAIDTIVESVVVVAIDNVYAGYIVISDELKHDALQAVQGLHKMGVADILMLSGDRNSIVQKVAQQIGIASAYGDLLPEDKLLKVEMLRHDTTKVVAFVGDGLNDAPVLAASDIGIVMGAMGSDAAIETADVVIQTDHPSKIVTAIKIGKETKKIVVQNIVLSLTIKAAVMLLGALGIATMWEAVFADVGVALLAILNALRILRMRMEN